MHNSFVHTYTVAADPRQLIEELRIRRGFPSDRALALAADISQPTLARYLSGKTSSMVPENFMKLAHTLGVTLSELMGEVPLGSSTVAREMQQIMATLTPEEQHQVLRVVKAIKGA